MKTEAELLEAKRAKEASESPAEEDPTPDILLAVVYTQDSVLTSR